MAAVIGRVGEIKRLFYNYVNRIYETADNERALMIRIRELRIAQGLTQAILAKLTGIEPTRLSVLERPGGSPRPDKLRRIARGLGVSVDDLLDDVGVA